MKNCVTASYTLHGTEQSEVPVVNPGHWFGECYLIEVACGYSSFPHIVEAGDCADALDILAEDDEHGHLIRVAEEDYGDYWFEVGRGDIVGGREVEEDGWMNLKGEFSTDENVACCSPEHQVSGQGVIYDDGETCISGPELLEDLRYHGVYEGVELPEEGIRPADLDAYIQNPFEVTIGGRTALVTRNEEAARAAYEGAVAEYPGEFVILSAGTHVLAEYEPIDVKVVTDDGVVLYSGHDKCQGRQVFDDFVRLKREAVTLTLDDDIEARYTGP